MHPTLETKNIVLKYFNSYQHKNLKELRDCLAKHIDIDVGSKKFKDADKYTEFCKSSPLCTQIKLIDCVFADEQAALMYEGVNDNGDKIRVAEFITLENQKIINVRAIST